MSHLFDAPNENRPYSKKGTDMEGKQLFVVEARWYHTRMQLNYYCTSIFIGCCLNGSPNSYQIVRQRPFSQKPMIQRNTIRRRSATHPHHDNKQFV